MRSDTVADVRGTGGVGGRVVHRVPNPDACEGAVLSHSHPDVFHSRYKKKERREREEKEREERKREERYTIP